MSEADRAALAAQYTSATRRLREMLVETLIPLFTGLGRWRPADLEVFLEQALPLTLGAQEAMARLTDTYLSARIADHFGQAAAPLGVEAVERIRGVDPETVYARPFAQVWTDLSRGRLLSVAVQHGANRLTSIALTDLQLQKTHTAREVFSFDTRVTGYRRVPKGAETCALCLIASTQPYTKRELAPIHPGCDCDVAEIVGDDPGTDPDLLEAVHEAVARDLGGEYVDRGGRETDYRKLTVVHEHGELGPVLGVRGQHFTGPNDLS